MVSWLTAFAMVLAAATAAAADPIVPMKYPPGTLHGFPSMSDTAGNVIADGELTQVVQGDRLLVSARWRFKDGHEGEETDTFTTRDGVVGQDRYAWVERRAGQELRRFEVDFDTGQAVAVTLHDGKPERDEQHLDLRRGKAFTGYGAALATIQLAWGREQPVEITFVAFTPKPRDVTLEIRREGEEQVGVAGRTIACDRFVLHPKLPFPVSLFAHPPDAHLWLTHAGPPMLVRGQQNLAAKDDPQVVIDVIPRGAAHQETASIKSGRP
jgi:hypothetical protein